jgi:hypothetical protein
MILYIPSFSEYEERGVGVLSVVEVGLELEFEVL